MLTLPVSMDPEKILEKALVDDWEFLLGLLYDENEELYDYLSNDSLIP